MTNRNRKQITALAAAVAGVALAGASRAATVNGTVDAGEYGTTLATQNTPTGFGNNFSELNQAFANYVPGGALELALTGNLEGNGNGLVIFVDSRAGGAIANSVTGGGYGQFGSVGGAMVDDWGTDTNGGTDVTPTPGGGSILAPNFNPDFAIQINAGGGGANYFINVIDLTVPNEPSDNRDVFVGGNATGSGSSVTQTYFRDLGFVDAGDITHAFNNSNTAGVNGYDFTTPPGPLGDPASATTGFEFLFEDQFIGHQAGQPVRILPFITSGGGDFLANQFLPGVNGDGNLGGPGAPGGAPLFDARSYNGDQFYLTLFTPTSSSAGAWTGLTFTGGAVPNGAEKAAVLNNPAATIVNLDTPVTLGYLQIDSAGGYTIGGGSTLNFNGGNGAAALFASGGAHAVNQTTNVQSDTRMNVAGGSMVSLNGNLSMAAGKRITKAGAGTLNLNGPQLHGGGASLAVDSGTLNAATNLGNGLAQADRPDLFVGAVGAATANLAVTQTLDSVTANTGGTIQLASGGGSNRVLVANSVGTTGTGQIDLTDNKMIVKGGTPTGTFNTTTGNYDGVTRLAQTGRNGGTWDGPGLVTSQTHADSGLTTLAVVAANDTGYVGNTFGGQSVAAGDTLVMYTYGGDADLNGTLDSDDYFAIDSNFNLNGSVFGYNVGDFDYNGAIDSDDYFIIDSNWNNQILGQFPTSAGEAAGVTAVPEPASLAAVALGGLGLLRRSRRRR